MNFIIVIFRKSNWTSEDIFFTISSMICCNERYYINVNVLKWICALFPFIMLDIKDESIMQHGNILLSLLEIQLVEIDKILSYNIKQLLWIMQNGNCILKERVIQSWLQKGDLDVLVEALRLNKNALILFELLVDKDLQEPLIEK